MTKKIAVLLLFLVFTTVSANAQNRLKGDWRLVSMTDEKGVFMALPEKKEIRLSFVGSKVRAQACNNLSGKYSAKNRRIKIDFTLTTAKACPESITERSFTRLTESANTFSVSSSELILFAKKNRMSLKFTRIVDEKTVELNGKWRLVSMTLEKNRSISLTGKDITLNIDRDKIGGNGGCNAYGGNFSQTGKTVKFSEIFSTKMWCENSSPTEQEYFNALEKTVNYEFKNDRLILTDEKKENTLVFRQN